MMHARRFACLPAALFAAVSAAAGAPGGAGHGTYVIQNGTIHTVSGPVIQRGSVVMTDGRIAQVGAQVTVPAGAQIVDATGLSVYPGLFHADSQLGMSKTVEGTLGQIRPQLQSYVSFHFEDSEAEFLRLSGITEVMIRPLHLEFPGGYSRPGLVPGQASVVSLQGGSPEEMVVGRGVGVVVHYPTVGLLDYMDDERYEQTTWTESKAKHDKEMKALKGFFDDARKYMQRKDALPPAERARMAPTPSFEAMIPVFKRERPLLLDVDNHVDVRSAVGFAEAQKVDYVLLGAEGAAEELDFLKEHNARVIIISPYKVSESTFEDMPIDGLRRLPARLHAKGIPFALSSSVANGINPRLLPYEAGTAAAYGLPKDVALKSVTLAPAQLLGLEKELGSIDAGKRANIVVTDGDILEPGTRVLRMFINGEPVDLETEDARMFEHYKSRR
jgi:imidazolonepropionase-like amidohydrolase